MHYNRQKFAQPSVNILPPPHRNPSLARRVNVVSFLSGRATLFYPSKSQTGVHSSHSSSAYSSRRLSYFRYSPQYVIPRTVPLVHVFPVSEPFAVLPACEAKIGPDADFRAFLSQYYPLEVCTYKIPDDTPITEKHTSLLASSKIKTSKGLLYYHKSELMKC